MVNVRFHFKTRNWMVFFFGFYLVASLPILGIITYALIVGDLSRLFFGGMILAGYGLLAELLVKLAIAIDEQYLRHSRLHPDANGRYERPLHEDQVREPVQFSLCLATGEGLETEAGSLLHDESMHSYEEGLLQRR